MKYRQGINHTNADMLSSDSCGTCIQSLLKNEDTKTEKMKKLRINEVENIKDCRWQKNSSKIDQSLKNCTITLNIDSPLPCVSKYIANNNSSFICSSCTNLTYPSNNASFPSNVLC